MDGGVEVPQEGGGVIDAKGDVKDEGVVFVGRLAGKSGWEARDRGK